MANSTISTLTTTAVASVTSDHFLVIDNAVTNSTTKLSALAAAIQTITTLGSANASVIKSFSLGTLSQRDIIGGAGITVAENTNDLTFSVTQGDININNLAGISSFDLSTANNTTSAFLSNVDLTSNVTGTLPVTSGGTGRTSFTAGTVLLGGATSITQATLDRDLEILVGNTSTASAEAKALTAGSNISLSQNNSLNTVTIGFTKGDYIEDGDTGVTFDGTTTGALTTDSIQLTSVGSAAQTTALTDSVTINAPAGVIRLYAGTIVADTNTQFTVNNSSVRASSIILLTKQMAGAVAADNGIHISIASVTNGSFVINVTHTGNQNAGAVVRQINFFVLLA